MSHTLGISFLEMNAHSFSWYLSFSFCTFTLWRSSSFLLCRRLSHKPHDIIVWERNNTLRITSNPHTLTCKPIFIPSTHPESPLPPSPRCTALPSYSTREPKPQAAILRGGGSHEVSARSKCYIHMASPQAIAGHHTWASTPTSLYKWTLRTTSLLLQ